MGTLQARINGESIFYHLAQLTRRHRVSFIWVSPAISPIFVRCTIPRSYIQHAVRQPITQLQRAHPRLFQLTICIYVWTQLPSLFAPHQAVLGDRCDESPRVLERGLNTRLWTGWCTP